MPTHSESLNAFKNGADFRNIFEKSPAHLLALTPEFKILAVTDAFLSMTKTNRQDILGKGLFDAFPENPRDPASTGPNSLRRSLELVLKTHLPQTMPVQRYDIKNSEENGKFNIHYWCPSHTPILDSEGNVEMIIHSSEDVTEVVNLKIAQGHWQEAEKEFLGRSNEMVAEMMRREDQKDILAQRSLMDKASDQAKDLQREDRSNEMAAELILRKDQAVVLAKQKVIDGVANQAKEHRLHEEAELKFKSLLEMAPDAMVVIDRFGTILVNNSQAETLFGYEDGELLGKSANLLLPASRKAADTQNETNRFATPLNRPPGAVIELSGRRKDFSEFPFEVTFNPLSTVDGMLTILAIRDLTERRKLNAQLIRAQRLESIGTFAGNIAHDLNNALAPILMSLELLREMNPNSVELVNMIESGANRGADMLRQLLVFSKGSYFEPKRIDMSSIFKDIEELIQTTFPDNIKLESNLAEDLCPVLGDPTQIYQVLFNLCINARDAMPVGGILSLSVESVEIDHCYASAVPGALPGSYVVCKVSDTGTGIVPEILDRIFEPFFSTKGHGKGTGLGLSIVVGIVKSHHGFLNAYSTPSKGSTFSVYLPADLSEVADSSPVLNGTHSFQGKGEVILVVDDSEGMRDAARTVLSVLKLRAITAIDGRDALQIVEQLGTNLSAIITDVHMPNMDGLAFVKELRRILPDIGIIVISGNLDEAEANSFRKMGVRSFLDKPFTQEKLIAALSQVIS